MELDNRCPFCGGINCERVLSSGHIWSGTDALYFNCKEGFQCTIHPSVWYGDEKEVVKRFHQIYLFMKDKPYIKINGMNYKYFFYYEEKSIGQQPDHPQKKNVAELMKNYPKTFMDKMEKIIYNLAKKYPIFGEEFIPEICMQHLLYVDNYEEEVIETEVEGVLDALVELGYLNHKSSNYGYRISAKGWNKISEMEHNETNNQGFIAMAFKEEKKESVILLKMQLKGVVIFQEELMKKNIISKLFQKYYLKYQKVNLLWWILHIQIMELIMKPDMQRH